MRSKWAFESGTTLRRDRFSSAMSARSGSLRIGVGLACDARDPDDGLAFARVVEEDEVAGAHGAHAVAGLEVPNPIPHRLLFAYELRERILHRLALHEPVLAGH
jgi:hypothetical protein